MRFSNVGDIMSWYNGDVYLLIANKFIILVFYIMLFSVLICSYYAANFTTNALLGYSMREM